MMENGIDLKNNNYDNIDYLKIFGDNIENNKEKIDSIEMIAFDYLSKIETNETLKNEKVLTFLNCLSTNSRDSKTFNKLNSEFQNKFSKCIIHLLENAIQSFEKEIEQACQCKENNAKRQPTETSIENIKIGDQKENTIEIIRFSARIVCNYSDSFTLFSKFFIENHGLNILFKYFEIFIEKALIIKDAKPLDNLIDIYISFAISNLSKLKNSFNQKWKEVNAIKHLLNAAGRIKDNKNLSEIFLAINMSIALIFEENDFEKLENVDIALTSFSRIMQGCAQTVKDGLSMRYETEIDGKCINVVYNEGSSSVEILDCLKHLAVSDIIKNDIYFRFKAKDYLRDLIYCGNDCEREHSFRLLWQLCFDINVAEDIRNDYKLYSIIQGVSFLKKPEELLKSCNGMIWLMDEKYKPKKEKVSVPKVMTKSKHIMISYNSKSKEMCLKIKTALEKEGYKIWIDVVNIHGSSLEAMANAIEESYCVLMCMTARYKQSANCRLEAEYTVNINKPFVPLILEKAYKPDGWLGLILGSKIFIDFTKYDFEECIKRLIKEVIQFNESKEDVKENEKLENEIKEPIEKKIIPKSINALNWSELDAEKWIKDKKFHKEIAESLLPCNGKLLNQLFEMYNKIPDYFYSSLNGSKTIRLRDLLYFSNELKEIFEK